MCLNNLKRQDDVSREEGRCDDIPVDWVVATAEAQGSHEVSTPLRLLHTHAMVKVMDAMMNEVARVNDVMLSCPFTHRIAEELVGDASNANQLAKIS